MISEDLLSDILLVTNSILNNEFNEDLLKILRYIHIYITSVHKDPYKYFKERPYTSPTVNPTNSQVHSSSMNNNKIVKDIKTKPMKPMSKITPDKTDKKEDKAKKIRPKKEAFVIQDKKFHSIADLIKEQSMSEYLLSMNLNADEARIPYYCTEGDADSENHYLCIRRIGAEGSISFKQKVSDQPSKLECKLQLLRNSQCKMLSQFKMTQDDQRNLMESLGNKYMEYLKNVKDFKNVSEDMVEGANDKFKELEK